MGLEPLCPQQPCGQWGGWQTSGQMQKRATEQRTRCPEAWDQGSEHKAQAQACAMSCAMQLSQALHAPNVPR